MVEAVLGAVADIFPDEYLHLGGDEVRLGCWEEDPNLMAWAAKELGNTENQRQAGLSSKLLEVFEARVLAMATKQLGKRIVLWQGALDMLGDKLKTLAAATDPTPTNTTTTTTGSNASEVSGKAASSSVPSVLVQPWKCWSSLHVRIGMHEKA